MNPMNDSGKAIIHILISIGVGIGMYFTWGGFRPYDPLYLKIGSGIATCIISFLFLHFATSG